MFNGTLRENLVLGLPVVFDNNLAMAKRLDKGFEAPKVDILISEGGRPIRRPKAIGGSNQNVASETKYNCFDEPTASMDGQLEAQVMDYLFEKLTKIVLL